MSLLFELPIWDLNKHDLLNMKINKAARKHKLLTTFEGVKCIHTQQQIIYCKLNSEPTLVKFIATK